MATNPHISEAAPDENKSNLIRLFAMQGITAEPTQQALDFYALINTKVWRSGYDEGIDTMKSDWP